MPTWLQQLRNQLRYPGRRLYVLAIIAVAALLGIGIIALAVAAVHSAEGHAWILLAVLVGGIWIFFGKNAYVRKALAFATLCFAVWGISRFVGYLRHRGDTSASASTGVPNVPLVTDKIATKAGVEFLPLDPWHRSLSVFKTRDVTVEMKYKRYDGPVETLTLKRGEPGIVTLPQGIIVWAEFTAIDTSEVMIHLVEGVDYTRSVAHR